MDAIACGVYGGRLPEAEPKSTPRQEGLWGGLFHRSVQIDGVSTGKILNESVDSCLTAVTRRFWWPVYAEFRDHGHAPETSLNLCKSVIFMDPSRISNGLRHSGSQGRLRCWIEDRTSEVLKSQGHPQTDVEPIPVSPEEAEARDPLRWATRNSRLPPFHQRWAYVLLETALERLLAHSSDLANPLELEGLLGYLDQPVPSRPVDDFPGWIQAPQILTLKQRFWRELRQAVDETLVEPQILEIELLDLFPPQ